MLVEGDCTVNENTKTLDTVRCTDVDHSSIECVDLLPNLLTWGCAEYDCFSLFGIQAQSSKQSKVKIYIAHTQKDL